MALAQPLDQGIICDFRQKWKKKLLVKDLIKVLDRKEKQEVYFGYD